MATRLRFVILLCLTTVLCGCTRAPAGRLLIVGGGLSSENGAVFRALNDEPGERIDVVVIPVASGIPERSGPGTAADIHTHLRGVRVTVLDPRTDAHAGVVAAIDGADAVWFTGGDQSRITEHVGGTAVHEALRRLLRRGGTIAGTSAGAAMMGETMITGGRSKAALEHGATFDPEGPGVTLALGMGFLPGVLTDQHFVERDRQGRLRVALRATGIRYGLGVNEDRAVLVDLASGVWTAIGAEACVVMVLDGEAIEERTLGDGEAFVPGETAGR